jgi:hypothetical protein
MTVVASNWNAKPLRRSLTSILHWFTDINIHVTNIFRWFEFLFAKDSMRIYAITRTRWEHSHVLMWDHIRIYCHYCCDMKTLLSRHYSIPNQAISLFYEIRKSHCITQTFNKFLSYSRILPCWILSILCTYKFPIIKYRVIIQSI